MTRHSNPTTVADRLAAAAVCPSTAVVKRRGRTARLTCEAHRGHGGMHVAACPADVWGTDCDEPVFWERR